MSYISFVKYDHNENAGLSVKNIFLWVEDVKRITIKGVETPEKGMLFLSVRD